MAMSAFRKRRLSLRCAWATNRRLAVVTGGLIIGGCVGVITVYAISHRHYSAAQCQHHERADQRELRDGATFGAA